MGEIDREDMLELTRRMTLKRNCFGRIAGAYFDREGNIDGTFNQHFLNLEPSERDRNLKLAKKVIFSRTNEQLREYSMTGREMAGFRRILTALNGCELKNDALLETYYEEFGRRYRSAMGGMYAVYFFHGCYDIPLKGTDKERQWESEEVYPFLISAVSPVDGDYEPGEPEYGFLYPAFKNRSGNEGLINVFQCSWDGT